MSNYTSPAQSPVDGMAMNWVLDHVMTHPKSYESTLPLRTIYTLNSKTPHASPADFKTMLMEHLTNMPAQPCTLPPVFLTTFVQKCFPQEFNAVDFDQALTALDYIRDIEIRRKKELEKAIRARGAHDRKVVTLRTRSAKLDLQYAKALVGIRRWTLIAELSMPRFNKCNCVALLNTLYPIDEAEINSHLTAPVLAQQRLALWKYITGVEKGGPRVLESVRNANGGWESVSNAANTYCRVAIDLIQKAEDLSRPTSIGSFQSDTSTESAPISPKKSFTRVPLERHDTSSSSVEEFEPHHHHKRSTIEKIVRGLHKLSGSTSSSNMKNKSFYSSEWSGSDEDVKMRFAL